MESFIFCAVLLTARNIPAMGGSDITKPPPNTVILYAPKDKVPHLVLDGT